MIQTLVGTADEKATSFHQSSAALGRNNQGMGKYGELECNQYNYITFT